VFALEAMVAILLWALEEVPSPSMAWLMKLAIAHFIAGSSVLGLCWHELKPGL
jgi:hypothetical protein